MDEKDDDNPLSMRVAVVVAILATFMGICKVKDDNINQAMQQAQANKVDHWSFYQARNIREEVANSTIVQLKLAKAEQDDKTYDALNFKDDQFDLSDAMLAIAIALLAITALTKQRWLFMLSMVPTAFGVFMGLCGLFSWHFHPTALVALLS